MKKRIIIKQIKKLQKLACIGLNSIKEGDIVYGDNLVYKITSKVYLTKFSPICMDAEVYNYKGIKLKFKKNLFLRDFNVVEGGYNLYRVFHSKKDAQKYDNLIKKISSYKEENPNYKWVKPTKGSKINKLEITKG